MIAGKLQLLGNCAYNCGAFWPASPKAGELTAKKLWQNDVFCASVATDNSRRAANLLGAFLK